MFEFAIKSSNMSTMDKLRKHVGKALKWSEKYTNTDMVYLTKGGTWLTIGHFVSTLSAFLLAIAFANFLPKEVYGTYKFILSIAGILTITSLGGLNTSISQAVSRGFEGSFYLGLKTKIKWGILGAVGSLGISLYYYLNANELLSMAFLSIAIFMPFFDSIALYESYLQGKKLFKESIVYFTLSRLITFVAILLSIVYSNEIIFILLSYFISWTLVRLLFLYLSIRKFPPNDKIDTSTTSYGKHLSLIGIISSASNYLDSLVLFHFLGPIQVAIYTFAFAPIEQIRSAYKNIPLLAVPKLSNNSISDINRLYWSRIYKLTLVGIFVAITYLFMAPHLFDIFFPQYPEAIFFSQLLAIILVLRLPLSFSSAVLQSKLNITPKSWLYWRGVSSFIIIIALLILTPLYGIIGVVMSRIIFVISQLVTQLVQWQMFVKGRHEK